MPPDRLKYRADIDGMRAVAVIAVILFHAFPNICPGGFIGVDVFFVISGYLITSIILLDLGAGKFSFSHFYARRIQRIFPALLLVLVFCLMAGWLLLTPREWRSLVEQTLAGAGMFSNLTKHGSNGYFDLGSRSLLLLHLWSLGIEEQFYVVWSVVLVLLWKRSRRVLIVILSIGALSFAFNAISIQHQDWLDAFYWSSKGLQRMPELLNALLLATPFYNPVARMWELLAGAALARFTLVHGEIKDRRVTELLSVSGALLMGLGLLLLKESDPFPGWRALLPVTSAVCLIAAGQDAWFNRRLLAWRPAVWIGLISYPMYLWHWPLLTFLRLVNASDFHLDRKRLDYAIGASILLTVVLSWATYRLWEMPLRFSSVLPFRVRTGFLLGAIVAMVLVSAFLLPAILPRLHSPAVLELERAENDIDYLAKAWKPDPLTAVEFHSHSKNSTLLVGDSHMEQYMPRARSAIQADPRLASAVFATSAGCVPLPDVNPVKSGFQCPALYRLWIGLAHQPRFSTVVLSAAWDAYSIGLYPPAESGWGRSLITIQGHAPLPGDYQKMWEAWETDLRELVWAGKRVVIFASNVAYPGFDPRAGLVRLDRPGEWRLTSMPRAQAEQWLSPVTNKLKQVAADSGAEIILPLDYLCKGAECPALDTDGSPIYADSGHIRAAKSSKLAVFVDDVLRP